MTYACPFCKERFRLKASLHDHLGKDRCTYKPYFLTLKEKNLLIKNLKSIEEQRMERFTNWKGRLE